MPISQKCIEALIAKNKGNKYNLGKKHTHETKKRIKEAGTAENNPGWKGGLPYFDHQGYLLIYVRGKGRIKEQIHIMEEFIGRRIIKGEVVHHINEIKSDNRIENLQLMTKAEHMSHHKLGKKQSKEEKEKKRKWNIENNWRPPSWKGRKHKPETIEKFKLAHIRIKQRKLLEAL